MGTTSLIVELVVIGMQTVVWICLLMLSIWGFDWIDVSVLKDWSGVIAVALTAISYSFGTLFDSVAGIFLTSWSYASAKAVSNDIRQKVDGNFQQQSPIEMSAYILATDTNLRGELDSMFNRNKLLRATSINLIFLSLAATIFVVTRIGFNWQSIASLAMLTFLAVICARVWKRSFESFYLELALLYIAVRKRDH